MLFNWGIRWIYHELKQTTGGTMGSLGSQHILFQGSVIHAQPHPVSNGKYRPGE